MYIRKGTRAHTMCYNIICLAMCVRVHRFPITYVTNILTYMYTPFQHKPCTYTITKKTQKIEYTYTYQWGHLTSLRTTSHAVYVHSGFALCCMYFTWYACVITHNINAGFPGKGLLPVWRSAYVACFVVCTQPVYGHIYTRIIQYRFLRGTLLRIARGIQ